jgi:hypothetical protein
MENLDRIVADTLAEHGFETPVYLRPIPWSRWFRCESSFSLLLVPSAPGLYALAEEVAAPGEAITSKRMLAVFEIAEADDLCVMLSRHFAPSSALSARLASGRCFVRFAQLRDAERRRMVCNSLKRWMAASTQTATGLPPEISTKDLGIARDFTKSEPARTNYAHDAAGALSVPASLNAPVPTPPVTSCEITSVSKSESDEMSLHDASRDMRTTTVPAKSFAESTTVMPPPSPAATTAGHAPSAFTSSPTVLKPGSIEQSPYEPSQDECAASGDEPPPLPSGF